MKYGHTAEFKHTEWKKSRAKEYDEQTHGQTPKHKNQEILIWNHYLGAVYDDI